MQIAAKPFIVESKSTNLPGDPVNTSATKNGWDKNLCIFLALARARKIQRFLSQPFFVAEVFTGSPGKLVDLDSTIKGFAAICKGDYDHLPEAAFYMVGTIEEAIEKADKMTKEAAA